MRINWKGLNYKYRACGWKHTLKSAADPKYSLLHIYLGSGSLQRCQSAGEGSGSPPLGARHSKTQPGSLPLSCDRKRSLAKTVPTVVKPLEVQSVCWELCSAELVQRWLSCSASCRGHKGRRQCLPAGYSILPSCSRWRRWWCVWPTAPLQHPRGSVFLLLNKSTQSIRGPPGFESQPACTFVTTHDFFPLTHLSFTILGPSPPKSLLLQPEIGSFGRECQSVAQGHCWELR